jgi:hypothetical protein
LAPAAPGRRPSGCPEGYRRKANFDPAGPRSGIKPAKCSQSTCRHQATCKQAALFSCKTIVFAGSGHVGGRDDDDAPEMRKGNTT